LIKPLTTGNLAVLITLNLNKIAIALNVLKARAIDKAKPLVKGGRKAAGLQE
jgi:hypothetical protein